MEHLRLLESQFLNDKFADIYFIIGTDANTVKIPSHKAILAAGSLPLDMHFTKNIDINQIEIVNSTPAAFKEFLFTFYSSYPEKNFTIGNALIVLELGKTFEVVHCIKAAERFLMKNLSVEQLCFGYSLAMEYSLFDLKSHCMKQINDKKHDVFGSHTFLACNSDVLYDILGNLTVNHRDDIETIWNACIKWAQNQCTLRSIDASNIKNWREMLDKSVNQMHAILSKDSECLSHVMAHYKALFENDENQNELWITCHVADNKNDTQYQTQYDTKYESLTETETILCTDSIPIEELEFARFRETILSPQTCHANVPILIEVQSTKRLALAGVAFSTISGSPKGKLTIGMRSADGDITIIEQLINSKPKRNEPKNFVAIENVILEQNQIYLISIELSKDVAYRASRRIEKVYQANDFSVSFKSISRRDIFSHFFFREHFQ